MTVSAADVLQSCVVNNCIPTAAIVYRSGGSSLGPSSVSSSCAVSRPPSHHIRRGTPLRDMGQKTLCCCNLLQGPLLCQMQIQVPSHTHSMQPTSCCAGKRVNAELNQ